MYQCTIRTYIWTSPNSNFIVLLCHWQIHFLLVSHGRHILHFIPVLWIRIWNFCLDPDPELLFRIRIQQNMNEQMNKNVISLWILDFEYCMTVVWNIKLQIVDRFFFMIDFKVVFLQFPNILKITWVGSGSAWIRNFCPDPEIRKFRAGSGINHSGSTTLFNSKQKLPFLNN